MSHIVGVNTVVQLGECLYLNSICSGCVALSTLPLKPSVVRFGIQSLILAPPPTENPLGNIKVPLQTNSIWLGNRSPTGCVKTSVWIKTHREKSYTRGKLPGSNTPISSVCLWCFGFSRGFVKISAVCSGSRQSWMSITLFFTSSLTQ
jgi:hypothetical protein